jgi:hypothetical protein
VWRVEGEQQDGVAVLHDVGERPEDGRLGDAPRRGAHGHDHHRLRRPLLHLDRSAVTGSDCSPTSSEYVLLVKATLEEERRLRDENDWIWKARRTCQSPDGDAIAAMNGPL